MNSEKILYSRREAAQLLSISVRTLDRLIGNKALRPRRVGRRVMLSHVELIKLSRKDTLVIQGAGLSGTPQESRGVQIGRY